MSGSRPSRPRPVVSLLVFSIWVALLAFLLTRVHYELPVPGQEDYKDGEAVFNERRALDIIERWGRQYRIVGTADFVEAEKQILDLVYDTKRQHEASELKDLHEIEVWHQVGSSSHLFDFMGKPTWKKYLNLTNVVVRISDGTPASKANAILVNAHTDSTLPSPGAADDGAGVAVMLEALRVITSTPTRLSNAIVLLFNGAEESLQDASHLFITQHEIKDTIRAVINLEACGTAGAEILFQATSEEMIRAYAKVPYPYGAVLATELFATGLILSDTDFRQFEQYGNLTGLDMALVGNSYFYHTRKDVPEHIEPGALQHMGENTLALLRHLTSPNVSLKGIKKSHSTIFFSMMGGKTFTVFTAETARLAYIAIAMVTSVYMITRARWDRKMAYVIATGGILATLLSGLVLANMTAFWISFVRGRSLVWYRREYLAVILFGPPALIGACLAQLGMARYLRRKGILKRGEGLLQHISICALAIYYSITALFLISLNVLSSYLWAFGAATCVGTLIINDFVLVRDFSDARPMSLLALLIGQILPMLWATEGMTSILDLFVPLAGRLGADAPADHIIGSAVAVIVIGGLPMALPLVHRIGEKALLRLIGMLLVFSVATSVIFTLPAWETFDADHQKRLFSLHMENITQSPPTHSLLVASADGESNFPTTISETLAKIGVDAGEVKMARVPDSEPSWSTIFPLGQLLNSVSIPLAADAKVSPWKQTFGVRVENESLNAVQQRRKLTLTIDHPGLIWTVIAFDADVIAWDLPEPPARGVQRHHIKEISGYGVDQWTLNLEIQLSPKQFEAAQRRSQRAKGQRGSEGEEEDAKLAGLRIDCTGLDRDGMWPASKARYRGGKPAVDFFKRFDEALPPWIDSMLLSAVALRTTLASAHSSIAILTPEAPLDGSRVYFVLAPRVF